MNTFTTTLAWMPGPWEMAIIAVLGILIFGKRLPEVGRGIGKSIVEFKKGLAGIDEEVDKAAQNQTQQKIEKEAGNTTNVDTHAESKANPSA